MVNYRIFINMQIDKNFVVYEHYTPDTNELFYVGEGRPTRPYSTRNRNRYWKFKIQKHNGFVVKIVKNNITKQEAEELEKKLILEYKNNNIKLTNLCDGTMFGSHWLSGKPKEMHPMFGKKNPNPKLSDWNKIHKGPLSPTYGLKRPDLSERNKSGLFKRFTKKIICIETNIVYNSIRDANISLNKPLKSTEISKHLNGDRKHAFGFQWKYFDN